MDNSILENNIRKVIGTVVNGNINYFDLWKQHILFTWQWWFQVGFVVVSVMVWILFRKKNSTGRLLYAGFFTLLVISWLDFVGNSYGLWYYPYKIIPTLPPFMPWEIMLCVEVLFLLQYKQAVSLWVKALVLGLFNAFIAEPIFHLMGLYIPVHWKYIYSVPIYFVIYLMAHFIVHGNSFQRLDEK